MTWQQDRKEWVNLNACKFCIGNHMHSCSLYQCKWSVRKAEKYFEREIEQEEFRRMSRKYVTDLWPLFTENLKVGSIVEKAWLISDGEKKEGVVKFKDIMSKIERSMALKLIGTRCAEMVQREDMEEGGESSFGKIVDGMTLREWRKSDEGTIRNGIPYDVK